MEYGDKKKAFKEDVFIPVYINHVISESERSSSVVPLKDLAECRWREVGWSLRPELG